MCHCDTGPLVALLNRDDQDHPWAVREGRKLPPKLISCEAVLSELHFLTRNIPEAKDRIESWLADRRLELPFSVRDHHTRLHELMVRYVNVPMSFADACWCECPNFGPKRRFSRSTPTSASIAATSGSRSVHLPVVSAGAWDECQRFQLLASEKNLSLVEPPPQLLGLPNRN